MKLRILTAVVAVSALSLTMAACGKKVEEATPAADTAADTTTVPSDSMGATPGTNAMATTQPTEPPTATGSMMATTPPATGSMATTPPAAGSMATTPPVDTPPQKQTAPNSGSVPPK